MALTSELQKWRLKKVKCVKVLIIEMCV